MDDMRILQEFESVMPCQYPSSVQLEKEADGHTALCFGFSSGEKFDDNSLETQRYLECDERLDWIAELHKDVGIVESRPYRLTSGPWTCFWRLLVNTRHQYHQERWLSLMLQLLSVDKIEGTSPSFDVRFTVELLSDDRDDNALKVYSENTFLLRVGESRGPKLMRLSEAPNKMHFSVRLQCAELQLPFCVTLVPARRLNQAVEDGHNVRHGRLRLLWDIINWTELHNAKRHGAELSSPLFGCCGALLRVALRACGDHLQPASSVALSLQVEYLPTMLRHCGMRIYARLQINNRLLELDERLREGELRGGCFGQQADFLNNRDLLIRADVQLSLPESLIPRNLQIDKLHAPSVSQFDSIIV